MSDKTDIRNLSFNELEQYFLSIDEKSYRAKQVFEWLYKQNVWSFDDIPIISKSLQEKLKENFFVENLEILKKEVSEDKTTKFLFNLTDGQKIETVLIPAETRTTACISTQAGCKFGCKFCASGIGGWVRNLTVAEILIQVLNVKEESKKHQSPLTNIVFMGVGEPLDNYENLMKAIRILNNQKAFNIGARRITVSTCGVIPKILELEKEDIQIGLAISLHGFDNESRSVLMPVNKKHPFNDLIGACREYQKKYRRQITFEYILIKDVTCTEKAVNALREAFRGLICKINLIPYNPVNEFDHATPSKKEMLSFRNKLEEARIPTTIRMPRGTDINGACGQLRNQ
jgi:23S rRNA (adenine2503-C2)-methyltransferase